MGVISKAGLCAADCLKEVVGADILVRSAAERAATGDTAGLGYLELTLCQHSSERKTTATNLFFLEFFFPFFPF